MTFRRKEPDVSIPDKEWTDLLELAQSNCLSLAYMLLLVVEDPEVVTDETREQVLLLIQDLEYGMARFKEWVI